MSRTVNVDLSPSVAATVQDEGGERLHAHMVGVAHATIRGVEDLGPDRQIEAVTLSAGGAVIAHVRAPGIVPIGVRRLSLLDDGEAPSERADYVLEDECGLRVELLPADQEAPHPWSASSGFRARVVWIAPGSPVAAEVVALDGAEAGLALLAGFNPAWRGVRQGHPKI